MIRAPEDDDDVEYVPVPMGRAMRAWLVEVANGCHRAHPADVASAMLRDLMLDDMSEHCGDASPKSTPTIN